MNHFAKIGICLGIIILVVAFVYLSKVKSDEPIEITSGVIADGTYCYGRLQIASTEAPYNVEEHITITISDGQVMGVKTGTQNGPDMTNGYEGTLTGTIDNSLLELTYAYTIEGSQGKELEIYSLDLDNLVKNRWSLIDVKKNGETILVPDMIGEPTLITYTKEVCSIIK